MNDRELLELAAKASGVQVVRGYFGCGECWLTERPVLGLMPWNPLTDDGDALRLAVKLRFEVQCYPGMGAVLYDDGSIDGAYIQQNPEKGQSDEQAVRRAIVRAAAEIGRDMP